MLKKNYGSVKTLVFITEILRKYFVIYCACGFFLFMSPKYYTQMG